MHGGTLEHIKAFVAEVAEIANKTGTRIEVYIDSPIYNTLNFSVEPVPVELGEGRADNVTQLGDGA